MRLALALVLLATPAAAEFRQWGGVVYPLLSDWSQGTTEGGVQVLLFDGDEDACSFCTVRIGPDAPATGDLAGWLATQSMAFVDEEDRGSVETMSGPEAALLGDRNAAMLIQRADSDIQALFAVEAGDRYQLLGFQGSAYDDEGAARSLNYLSSAVLPWMQTFRYAAEGAPDLMPEAAPGTLDGLWWGWNQGFTIGLDGIMQPTMEFRTLAFWPDGRFYDGTPPAGLAPLDPASLRLDGDWGTYREDGDAIVLSFFDGETERLARDGDGWSDGTRTLAPAQPLADGTALDGRLSSTTYAALGPAGGAVSGYVGGSSETVFRPDGTYEGSSVGYAAGTFSEMGTTTGGFATNGDPNRTGGAYEVQGGLVVMTPDDGSAPTRSLAFVNPEGETMIGDEFLEPR